MMREVERRSPPMRESGEENADGKWSKWPDLVLIDGGAAQLMQRTRRLRSRRRGRDRRWRRQERRARSRSSSTSIAAARRRSGSSSRVPCFSTSSACDEAHRFAIGSHRKRRAKAIGASPPEGIGGVGAGRKRKLLAHFGSARGVAQASVTDLEGVDGISKALARKIDEFFHGES